MKQISSLDNPIIKSIAQLKTKKGRESQQQFLAEGIRTCATIIENGLKPLYMFATQDILEKNLPFLLEYPIIQVTERVIEKISPVTTPSGLVSVFSIPKQPSYDLIKEGIVLANIQDPGNMGTLIRTCTAFGKKTVILTDGVEPWNPKVVQASAGTIATVHIFRFTWQELLAHKKNYKLVALVVKNGKHPQQIDFEKALLVIGSEAHGIPETQLETCNEYVTLPMPGSAESLNAATAGAIAMYLAWAPQ